jgi:hypothetical protein
VVTFFQYLRLSQTALASASEASAFFFQTHGDITVDLNNVGEVQKG